MRKGNQGWETKVPAPGRQNLAKKIRSPRGSAEQGAGPWGSIVSQKITKASLKTKFLNKEQSLLTENPKPKVCELNIAFLRASRRRSRFNRISAVCGKGTGTGRLGE